MYLDVIDLRDFYSAPLGKLVRRLVTKRLQRLWPDGRGMSIVGLGYATPFLGPFREESERVLAFMPARQGVAAWPPGARSVSALVDDLDLPLNDSSIDRFLLVHCLEMTDASEQLMAEIRRVLVPGGRLLAVAPNRRGLWARFDTTPFGHGRPYSRSQLTHLMRKAGFTAQGWEEALWVPPVRRQVVIRSAAAFERAGAFARMPAGLLLLDATKDERQVVPIDGKKARRLNILPVPKPATAPARHVEAPAGRA